MSVTNADDQIEQLEAAAERNQLMIDELTTALKMCAGVISGETLNKLALVRALEAAKAVLTKLEPWPKEDQE